MARHRDEDLFAESTMTFGEHLEELRRTLILALGGLMVGFAIGLLFATQVVEAIKHPLEKALKQFYVDKALHELKEEYGKDGKFVDAEVESFIIERKFVPEKLYVEYPELRRMGDIVRKQDEIAADSPSSLPAVSEETALPSPSPLLVLTRIWRPLDTAITTLNAQEAFMIYLKAGLVAGIVLSSPWMFWHIWTFVAAGLYRHERRYVFVFLPFSVGLFLAGVALAYFFVFEPVLNFLLSFNRSMNIEAEPRISEWISFVLFLPLGFGISFQLPLVMLFLERIGVFSVEIYLSKWRIAILVIFTLAMFLTPADPMSMLLMAVPLTVLYFGGVLLCHWMPRLRSPLEPPEKSEE